MHFWVPIASLIHCRLFLKIFCASTWNCFGLKLGLGLSRGVWHVSCTHASHLTSPPLEPEAYLWRNPADGRAAQHGEGGHPRLVLQPTAEREAHQPLQRHPSAAHSAPSTDAQAPLLQPAHGTPTHGFSDWSGPKPFRLTAGIEMLFGWCMVRMGANVVLKRHVWSCVWIMFYHKMKIGPLKVKENIKECHYEMYVC